MAKVAIVSLAKSGTHLISKALGLMGMKAGFHLGADSRLFRRSFLPSVIKDFEQPSLFIGLDMDVCVQYGIIRRALQEVSHDEFVTLHAGYSCALENLLNLFDFKTIIMTRDPRAVVVSYVYYVRQVQSHFLHSYFSSLSFNQCIKFVLKGGEVLIKNRHVYLNPFIEKLRRIEEWRKRPGVLRMTYENLVGVAGGGNEGSQDIALEEISRLLKKKTTQSKTADIKRKLYGGTETFRKGDVMGWRDGLSASMQTLLTQDLREFLLAWGYDM